MSDAGLNEEDSNESKSGLDWEAGRTKLPSYFEAMSRVFVPTASSSDVSLNFDSKPLPNLMETHISDPLEEIKNTTLTPNEATTVVKTSNAEQQNAAAEVNCVPASVHSIAPTPSDDTTSSALIELNDDDEDQNESDDSDSSKAIQASPRTMAADLQTSARFSEFSRRRKHSNLPKDGVNVLKKWLYAHQRHPYPSEEEKVNLTDLSKLTLAQVNNWFINARRRLLGGHTNSHGKATISSVKTSLQEFKRARSQENSRIQKMNKTQNRPQELNIKTEKSMVISDIVISPTSNTTRAAFMSQAVLEGQLLFEAGGDTKRPERQLLSSDTKGSQSGSPFPISALSPSPTLVFSSATSDTWTGPSPEVSTRPANLSMIDFSSIPPLSPFDYSSNLTVFLPNMLSNVATAVPRGFSLNQTSSNTARPNVNEDNSPNNRPHDNPPPSPFQATAHHVQFSSDPSKESSSLIANLPVPLSTSSNGYPSVSQNNIDVQRILQENASLVAENNLLYNHVKILLGLGMNAVPNHSQIKEVLVDSKGARFIRPSIPIEVGDLIQSQLDQLKERHSNANDNESHLSTSDLAFLKESNIADTAFTAKITKALKAVEHTSPEDRLEQFISSLRDQSDTQPKQESTEEQSVLTTDEVSSAANPPAPARTRGGQNKRKGGSSKGQNQKQTRLRRSSEK